VLKAIARSTELTGYLAGEVNADKAAEWIGGGITRTNPQLDGRQDLPALAEWIRLSVGHYLENFPSAARFRERPDNLADLFAKWERRRRDMGASAAELSGIRTTAAAVLGRRARSTPSPRVGNWSRGWLRSEFQNPEGRTQQAIAAGETETPTTAKKAEAAKRPWPKSLSAQAAAVQTALAEQDRRNSQRGLNFCGHRVFRQRSGFRRDRPLGQRTTPSGSAEGGRVDVRPRHRSPRYPAETQRCRLCQSAATVVAV
jgi:hypothetical protein